MSDGTEGQRTVAKTDEDWQAQRHIPWPSVFKGLTALALLLVLWTVIVYVSSDGDLTLVDVADSFIRLVVVGDSEGHTLIEHTLLSMYRVVLGFTVAIVTAVPLGIAVGRYRVLDSIATPVVEAMRPIPPIAWIPLAILMFSPVLLYSQVFIIWVGAFFPLLINTTAGVRRTEPVHIDVAKTFGANELQILRRVVIPSAAPEIFAGLRVGFGIGWMCLVAAEMVGSGLGLGYLVLIMQQAGRTGGVISGMLVIGLIGFFMNAVFTRCEKRLLRWRQEVAV